MIEAEGDRQKGEREVGEQKKEERERSDFPMEEITHSLI